MTAVTPITVAVESPLQDEVRVLIAELNASLFARTPPQYCSHMTVDQMADTTTTVFIARTMVAADKGPAVGCGALKRHGGGIAEVKRMYTRPSLTGRGVGGRILDRIEALARREGTRRLVLETGGAGYEAAHRVYERAGFARCGPVLDYPDTSYSVFFDKILSA